MPLLTLSQLLPHDSLFRKRQLAHPDAKIVTKYDGDTQKKSYRFIKKYNEGLTRENPFSDTHPNYELVFDSQKHNLTMLAKQRIH